VTYTVLVLQRAEKDLAALPQDQQTKILLRIRSLGQNPRPRQAKPLSGPYEGLFRLRSRDYRILYQIKDSEITVLVIRVLHRKEAYR
jgi:mRNA interferase RelE/StbE